MALILAGSIVAAVAVDFLLGLRKSKAETRTFLCFYCKKRTTRRDGYCSDQHRDEDLLSMGVEHSISDSTFDKALD